MSTYSQIDVTMPPSEPRPATVAANVRRQGRGTRTAPSSAIPDDPSSTRIVEIANQSTCGVAIT